MSIEIKEVRTRRQLRKFVNFPEKLYKDNPYYVPPLVFDQMDTLDQKKGAAQEFCDSKLYLAYKDGELAGRVAAIVNHLANKQWDHKEVRFGWYDFIDDPEVARALMDKVEEFGRQYGMESVVGPLGFTDFDPEGLLVEGFDRLSTMALIYNHPYYVKYIEDMGFTKDADWIEFKMEIPEKLPDRIDRICNIIQERNNVHLRQITRRIVREEDYGHKIFKAINECYKNLYNYTVLPDHMAEKYLDFYLSILDLRYISVVENDKNELVAFGISMPSTLPLRMVVGAPLSLLEARGGCGTAAGGSAARVPEQRNQLPDPGRHVPQIRRIRREMGRDQRHPGDQHQESGPVQGL